MNEMTQGPSARLVTVIGKGGVGKTTTVALLVDELARREISTPTLVIDGDPTGTLPMALGVEAPAATLAQVADGTPLDAGSLRRLPAGQTVGEHFYQALNEGGTIRKTRLRNMPLALLSMGHAQGAGCYCSVNRALGEVVKQLKTDYGLIVVDSEAGIEHVSRMRLREIDLLLGVTGPSPAAQGVIKRGFDVLQAVGLTVGQIGVIVNRISPGMPGGEAFVLSEYPVLAHLPQAEALNSLDYRGLPAPHLADDHPIREALGGVVDIIKADLIVPAGEKNLI